MLKSSFPPGSKSLRHSCRLRPPKRLVFKPGCNLKMLLERRRVKRMMPSPLRPKRMSKDSMRRNRIQNKRRRELMMSSDTVPRLLLVRDNMPTSPSRGSTRRSQRPELVRPRLVKSK
jgi:hypothetical protein